MSRFGRAAFACAAILVGCEDSTFELLPPARTAPDEATGAMGQSGDRGAAGTEGNAAASGKGGSGGSGDLGQGGSDEPNGCGPSGCGPAPGCKPEYGCFPCKSESDCLDPGLAHCDPTQHRCVNCRPLFDCAKSDHCERDCGSGETCDGATDRCAPECRTKPCPTSYLPVCDLQRAVCVDCSPGDMTGTLGCSHDLKCNYLGQCVECLSFADCPDSKPICNYQGECAPCQRDDECNPPAGYQQGFPVRVCYGGRCVVPASQ